MEPSAHTDPTTPRTRQELLDALTVERYGQPVPEWHNGPTATGAQARALRLIADNERRAA